MVGFYCVSWTNGPVSTSKKESVAGDTIADVLDLEMDPEEGMVGSSKLALLYEGGCKTGSAVSCGDMVALSLVLVEHWLIMLQGWGVTSRLIISSTCCKDIVVLSPPEHWLTALLSSECQEYCCC